MRLALKGKPISGLKLPRNINQSKPKKLSKSYESYDAGLFFKALVLILLLIPKSLLACRTYVHYEWQMSAKDRIIQEPRENLSRIKNAVDRNIKMAWGGWTVPPNVEKQWRDWLHNWELKTNNTNYVTNENEIKLQKERPDWPNEWSGLGEGVGGAPAPPWSFSPKANAKHNRACLKTVSKGKCSENITRWGYNPYLDKCMSYIWSGCGGSENNFRTEEQCRKACTGTAGAEDDCKSDSGIPTNKDRK